MEELIATRTKKKSLSDSIKEHPRIVFWTRFVLWVACAGVLPFIFIAWRFKIFNKIDQIQVTGWGIVAIVIAAAVVITIARYIKLAFKGRYSLMAQCLAGFCKIVVPLCALLLILDNIRKNVDLFYQVMCVVTVCETIAIPFNPLPKWAYEMQKDIEVSERQDTADYLLDGFFRRKKEDK